MTTLRQDPPDGSVGAEQTETVVAVQLHWIALGPIQCIGPGLGTLWPSVSTWHRLFCYLET